VLSGPAEALGVLCNAGAHAAIRRSTTWWRARSCNRLDAPALEATLDRVGSGTLLTVHWRHPTERDPFTGDEVHERLRARYAHHRLTPDCVLDRFEICGY
jgi:hypothetical protein